MKAQWGVQIRKAFNEVYPSFDTLTFESLKNLFDKAKTACTQYGLQNLTDVEFIIDNKPISMQGPKDYNSYSKQPDDPAYYQSFSDNEYKQYNYNPDLTQKPWGNYFSEAFTNVRNGKNKFQYLQNAGNFSTAYNRANATAQKTFN